MGQAKVRKMNGKYAKGPQQNTKRLHVDERELAIRQENAWLVCREALIKLANLSEEDERHVAWHESAHAVIDEVLSTGVFYVTIVPTANEEVAKAGLLELDSTGHVAREDNPLPFDSRTRCVHTVAGLIAGGIATEKALGSTWGTESDQDQISDLTLHDMNLSEAEAMALVREASALCKSMMDEPRVWKAIEEVKEALLTEKTINGHLVRAIVKKQDRPGLFPIEISKQLSFHFRQNYFAANYENGAAHYVLKLGGKPCCDRDGLANPPYVNSAVEEDFQPVPNFCPESIQMRLPLTSQNEDDNRAVNDKFAFRREMSKVDKLLLTGSVGLTIEIPGNHYVRGLSVVIKSREGNVMTFEWQGMSVIVTQDGFEFELCGIKDNSIGILLAAVIDSYAQDLDEEAMEPERNNWPLEQAA
jgi:hypothetical protein